MNVNHLKLSVLTPNTNRHFSERLQSLMFKTRLELNGLKIMVINLKGTINSDGVQTVI